MKKILVSIMIVSLIFSLNAGAEARRNAEVIFSETFEGDLSRWTLEGSREQKIIPEISAGKDEYFLKTLFMSYEPEIINSFKYESSKINILKSNPFNIEGDAKYTFAADISGDGIIYLQFLDENRAVIDDFKNKKIYPTKTNNWQTVSAAIDAPLTAKYAQVCLTSKETNTTGVSFDNVLVCKGVVAFETDIEKRKIYAPLAVDDSNTILEKEKNVIFFESFENGIDDWELSNKKSEKKVKDYHTKSYRGAKALQLKDDYIDAGIGAKSIVKSAFPGGKYTLSFAACNISGKAASISINFVDKEDRTILTKTVNSSANDKLWQKYEVTVLAPEGTKNLTISISSIGIGENFIDDIKLCEDLSGIDQNEIEFSKLYNSSMVLLLDSPNVLVNGEKMLIDKDNRSVCAKTVNSKTLVPVRFIAENFGAEVEWEGETETVTLKMTDKTVVIKLNDKEIKINDEVEVTDVPAQTLQGRTMLPLRFFAETVMGKYVHWDDAGLIVITDDKNDFLENNKAAVDKLIENVK